MSTSLRSLVQITMGLQPLLASVHHNLPPTDPQWVPATMDRDLQARIYWGYARVSTTQQNPDLQLDALRSAGCYRLFVDTVSGALDERPELAKVLDQLRPSDTLVVWKLDRLDVRYAT